MRCFMLFVKCFVRNFIDNCVRLRVLDLACLGLGLATFSSLGLFVTLLFRVIGYDTRSLLG